MELGAAAGTAWYRHRVLQLELEDILAAVRAVPELDVQGWDDINRIDVRPVAACARSGCAAAGRPKWISETGRVLQTAYRRTDLIESIHDGSFLAGNWSKLGIFLPNGLILLLLWATGLWLFWMPFSSSASGAPRDFGRMCVRPLTIT